MTSFDLTRQGLIRALSAAVAGSRGVDAALARRAGAVAGRAERQGLDARIRREGAGRYAVDIRGPDLSSRAFGSDDAPADGAIADIAGGGGAP